MKFIHLSDLHIGKKVNGFSMIDDQKYILTKILGIISDEKPDGVIIAGDVYDKSIPPTDAVSLFDDFLVKIASMGNQVFIISGNHDSAERVAFASRIMEREGVHISPVYNGEVIPCTLFDEYGEFNVYLLPFIKPIHIRSFFENETINSYTDAMRVAIDNMNVDTSKRNVIVTHQFITGAATADSEEYSVGGTDNVDVTVFDCFDYVALGHLHRPQKITRDTVRYCGTPLKYSFSEENDNKSVTVVEMNEKGSTTIREIPLIPLHDMITLTGKYNELMSKNYYEKFDRKSYIRVRLTDEEEQINAFDKMRTVYENIMALEYDNKRTKKHNNITYASDVKNKSTFELFSDFYEEQNNQPMSDEQGAFVKKLIEDISEGNYETD